MIFHIYFFLYLYTLWFVRFQLLCFVPLLTSLSLCVSFSTTSGGKCFLQWIYRFGNFYDVFCRKGNFYFYICIYIFLFFKVLSKFEMNPMQYCLFYYMEFFSVIIDSGLLKLSAFLAFWPFFFWFVCVFLLLILFIYFAKFHLSIRCCLFNFFFLLGRIDELLGKRDGW